MSQFENRYLCFRLDQEVYAAPLLDVKEVIGIPDITPIPQVPSYFLGIMNLRGQVISVVDLRLKFGLKASRQGETCIIIFEYDSFSVGVIVDYVCSVLSLKPGELCAPPDSKHTKKNEFITGVINRDNKMILSLDIVRALDLNDPVVNKMVSQRSA